MRIEAPWKKRLPIYVGSPDYRHYTFFDAGKLIAVCSVMRGRNGWGKSWLNQRSGDAKSLSADGPAR